MIYLEMTYMIFKDIIGIIFAFFKNTARFLIFVLQICGFLPISWSLYSYFSGGFMSSGKFITSGNLNTQINDDFGKAFCIILILCLLNALVAMLIVVNSENLLNYIKTTHSTASRKREDRMAQKAQSGDLSLSNNDKKEGGISISDQ